MKNKSPEKSKLQAINLLQKTIIEISNMEFTDSGEIRNYKNPGMELDIENLENLISKLQTFRF